MNLLFVNLLIEMFALSFFSISPLSTQSITKRDVSRRPFTPDDIFITSPPRSVDKGVSLEYAVVKTDKDGKQVALPSTTLSEVTTEKAVEIGRKLGAKGIVAKPKPLPIPATSQPRTGGTNGGLIAGVIVAVLLLVIIAAVSVWYFRYIIYTFIFSWCIFRQCTN